MSRIPAVSSLLSSQKIALAVAFCVLLGAAATARADTLLRYKFTPGEKLTYECSQNMSSNMSIEGKDMKTETKNTLVISQIVKSVDAEGVATLVKTIESAKMSVDLPHSPNLQYDSTEEKERSGMEKMIADQFAGVLGKPIEMKIDARGNIGEMKLPEALSGPRAGLLGGDKLQLALGAFSLPEEAVAVGKTWKTSIPMPSMLGTEKGTLQQTYEYMGTDKVDAALQKIKITTKLQIEPAEGTPARVKLLDQKSEGEIIFDGKAGRIKSNKSKEKMTFGLEMPGKTLETSMNINSEIKLVPNRGAK